MKDGAGVVSVRVGVGVWRGFFFLMCVGWQTMAAKHRCARQRRLRKKITMRRERPHQRRVAVIRASALRRQTVDADRLYLQTMRMQANGCNDPINCALALVCLILLFTKQPFPVLFFMALLLPWISV